MMAGSRIRGMALIPVNTQTLTLANTTAVAVNSTTRTARVLMISVETTAARMRADATAPTNSVGLALPTGLVPFVFDYNGTSLLRFNRLGGTGTSTVTILGFRYPGD